MDGWLPIATAPKDDGLDIIAFFPDFSEDANVMIAHRIGKDWYEQNIDSCPNPLPGEPTHWMPLPPRPAAKDATGDTK